MFKKLSVFVAICCLATACDDSDSNDSPKAEPVCGNSVVEEGEVCDTKATESLTCDKFDANKTWKAGGAAACSADCKKIELGTCVEDTTTPEPASACGNGTVDAEKGEVCDTKATESLTCDKFDANKTWKAGGTAACSADCKKIEQGTCVEDTTTPDQPGEVDFVVNVTPNPGPETRCNDGKHEAGEVCDPAYNGQYSDRNGNLKTCIATDEGKCVFRTEDATGKDKNFNCGNGTLDPGEGCDDGNTANGDGCSSSCTTETDTCIIKNGTIGQVLLVVDGDTLKIRITDDGNADKKASKALTVRMHGIDSPECLKAQTVSSVDSSYKANSCDIEQSKDYSNKEKNERGGYEAGEFVKSLVFSEENEGKIFVECETRSATDATCLTDATNNRFLAYIKVRSGGKIVDLAEETVRAGYAMAYTDFTSQRTSAYCVAEKEAIAAKAGVWNYGDTFKNVVEDNFNADKNRWLLDANHCK